MLLLLLLTACAEEPALRYEKDSGYFEESGAELCMELHFAETLAEGSELCLLDGEKTVLSLTLSSPTKLLTLRSPALQENVPYTLTINGITQEHGLRPTMPSAPIVDIPDQPTIPMEPMSEDAGDFTPGGSQEQPIVPPALLEEAPPRNPQGILPPQNIGDRKPIDEDLLAKHDPITFTITAENQSFTHIRDAMKPEGKEPNA